MRKTVEMKKKKPFIYPTTEDFLKILVSLFGHPSKSAPILLNFS